MDVIILAAGRGERLRPLTDSIPKPLIEVNGLSLIEIHLYRLAAAGFTRVIINLHHLGQRIKVRLGSGQRFGLTIIYSNEPHDALETAGGIVHALKWIQSDCFAAVSADVICDYPLKRLASTDLSSRHGHLVMVNNPSHHPEGDFPLDSTTRLITREPAPAASNYTFSGLACFRRSVFEPLEPGKQALRPVLEAMIDARQLGGELYTGLWSDIGTAERLDQARSSVEIGRYISSISASTS